MTKESRIGWYNWRIKRLRVRRARRGHKWSIEKHRAIEAKIEHFEKMLKDLDSCR